MVVSSECQRITVCGWTKRSVSTPGRPESRQERPEQTLGWRQARAAFRAGKHRELLAKRDVLRHEILASAKLAAQEGAKQAEIGEQAGRPMIGISLASPVLLADSSLKPGYNFGTPHVRSWHSLRSNRIWSGRRGSNAAAPMVVLPVPFSPTRVGTAMPLGSTRATVRASDNQVQGFAVRTTRS